MRGGALPPSILCATVGLLLAYAPRRTIVAATISLIVSAVAVFFLPLAPTLEEPVFLACWVSVMGTAAAIHLPGGPGPRLSIALGVNAGVWTGAVISVAGDLTDMAIALPWVLLVLPALWLRKTRIGIAVKIVASWLGAVAVLAAAVPLTPTPGYEPDHRE